MSDSTSRGHGGKQTNNKPMDPGAVGNGLTEYGLVSVCNDFFLKNSTGWVDDSDFSATTVAQNLVNIVNNVNKHAKAGQRAISQHFNAFNGKASGVEVWYCAGDEVMRKQAAKASAAIAKALGLVDRGAKATTALYFIWNTTPHALLIEWCFIDNPNDMAAWKKYGTKAMEAAMKALGIFKQSTTAKPKPVAKPKAKQKAKPHTLVTGYYLKNSVTHKRITAFCKKEGMGYKEVYKGDKVWLYLAFTQNSAWKRTLEKFLNELDCAYVLVQPAQVTSVINTWK